MKAESKRSVRTMLQWLLSAATVLMAALLIWQCVTIYHEGIAPENMGENGLRIHDIYSREIVTAHFASIAWSVWVFLALLAANIIAGKPEQKESLRAPVENQLLMLRTRTEETDEIRKVKKQRAYELGCLNTHFSNPHGLHDESHYTTARDLSIITQAALKSENFRQIVDTYEYQLPDDNMRQNIPKLKTTNMLIYRSLSNTLYYSRAHGIKTGYTSQAGRCVISEATGDGLDLLGIVCGAATTVLDSGDLLMENFTECARLFDYGFDNYSYLPIMSPLYPVDQVKINNSAGAEAVAVAPEDEIKVLLPNDYDPDKMVTDIQLNSESVDAPVREGDVLGSVTVSYAGEILGQTKLLAITDVARSEFSSAAAGTEAYIQKNWWKWVVIAIFAAIGVILVLIVLYQLRKRRCRRKRMEQRRRALENQRRRFREGYDLPVDELEQR